MPASRLKKEITRILVEQGYITAFEVEPTAVGESIRIQLKYTDDRDPVIRASSASRGRAAAATSAASGAARAGRHGHCDHLHVDRRDDRPRGQAGKGVGGEVVAYVW